MPKIKLYSQNRRHVIRNMTVCEIMVLPNLVIEHTKVGGSFVTCFSVAWLWRLFGFRILWFPYE